MSARPAAERTRSRRRRAGGRRNKRHRNVGTFTSDLLVAQYGASGRGAAPPAPGVAAAGTRAVTPPPPHRGARVPANKPPAGSVAKPPYATYPAGPPTEHRAARRSHMDELNVAPEVANEIEDEAKQHVDEVVAQDANQTADDED